MHIGALAASAVGADIPFPSHFQQLLLGNFEAFWHAREEFWIPSKAFLSKQLIVFMGEKKKRRKSPDNYDQNNWTSAVPEAQQKLLA